MKAAERLAPDNFTVWKKKVNEIAPFYKPDGLSEPSNKGALGVHFDVLAGRISALKGAIQDIKDQIGAALSDIQ